MAEAVYVHGGTVIDYTPAADVAAGDVVVQVAIVGVALRAIPANTTGSLAIEGVFDVVKTTGAGQDIPIGVGVYWDADQRLATRTASGNKYIGICVRTATQQDLTVRVLLSRQ